jgi:hypothetical protein
MAVRVSKVDDKTTRIGRALGARETQLLESKSPTGADIWDNLDDLNEEVEESHGAFLKNSKQEKTVSSPVARPTGRRVPRAVQAQRELAEEIPTPAEPEEDFDTMLNSVGQKEEAPGGVFMNEDERKSKILEYLNKLPNAPSAAQIAEWKRKRGQNGVSVIVFDDENVFVYTYLDNAQWRKLQEKIQKLAEQGDRDAEDLLKEKVVKFCTLWPVLPTEFFYTSRAGILESLYNAIWTESYFLRPEQVQMLTVQL